MSVLSNSPVVSATINVLDENVFDGRPSESLESVEAPGGTERIALAEDDPITRKIVKHLLEDLGYQVETYPSGTEVLAAMSRDCPPPIALLLTDHEMPGLTGYELARQFRVEYPTVHVLLASGHSKESVFSEGNSKDWPPFLRKPYSLRILARTLRSVLDGTAPE